MPPPTRASNKVTRIEVAVMGIVLTAVFSLLLPAMSVSRDVARENLCRRNLRWLDQATQAYIERHRELPDNVTWTADLLPFLMDQAGQDKHRVGFEIFTMPRPMFLTCPARPDIERVDGKPQAAHYTMISDVDQPKRSKDRRWSFRDRPLDLGDGDTNEWYMGNHTTPAEAEKQLLSMPGPHRNGTYLESDSQGGAVLRTPTP